MANSKIDSLKVGSSTYDITLPVDATPTIASLTTSTLRVNGTSNLTNVICSTISLNTLSARQVITGSLFASYITTNYIENTDTLSTTVLSASCIYGRWMGNTSYYLQGNATYSLVDKRSNRFSAEIYDITLAGGQPCIEFSFDIIHDSSLSQGTYIHSDLSGMDVVFEISSNMTGSVTASLTLTGTDITRNRESEAFVDINPCLMIKGFIGPGYIRYTFLSYNTGSMTTASETTSYFFFNWGTGESSDTRTLSIRIDEPFLTSSLDYNQFWDYPGWNYSGYIKTFYGSI